MSFNNDEELARRLALLMEELEDVMAEVHGSPGLNTLLNDLNIVSEKLRYIMMERNLNPSTNYSEVFTEVKELYFRVTARMEEAGG